MTRPHNTTHTRRDYAKDSAPYFKTDYHLLLHSNAPGKFIRYDLPQNVHCSDFGWTHWTISYFPCLQRQKKKLPNMYRRFLSRLMGNLNKISLEQLNFFLESPLQSPFFFYHIKMCENSTFTN